MRFWDSSAVVPLLVRELDSVEREKQLRDDPHMIVWWATDAECVSALARRVRDGALTEDQLKSALESLEALSASWAEVQPSERVKRRALRLLRVHPLRSADALQLSACLDVGGDDPRQMSFVCADARLCTAAEKEGLQIL